VSAGQANRVDVCLQIAPDVPDASGLDQAAFTVWVDAAVSAAVQDDSPAKGVVGIRVVSPAESAELNRNYRGKDAPTNILAFPAGPSHVPASELEEHEVGDLVLCLEVARSEADAQHKTLTQHIAHLTVHGTLHLLGYDHLDEADASHMEALERTILERLGLPDPYQNDAA